MNFTRKHLIYFFIFILFILFTIISTEFFLRKIYSNNEVFNCYKKIDDERMYINNSNCYADEKYFEKKNETTYLTNNFGNRIIDKNNELIDPNKIYTKILFFGDSFTFGHLSNYQFTYPYNAVNYLNKKQNDNYYIESNFGTNGYQFRQVLFSILKNEEAVKKSKFVIYGLPPNDLYDLQEKKYGNNLDKNQSLINHLRQKLNSLNILSIKIITAKILNNDSIYLYIHNNRGEFAGYLNKDSSNFWNDKYSIFENEISKIPDSIKKKLIISIIPQQPQIMLIKYNKIDDGLAFDTRVIEICTRQKIKCISNTLELAQVMQFKTHYRLDGHMLEEANKQYGMLLGRDIMKIK